MIKEFDVQDKVNVWLNGNYDELTKQEIRTLAQNDAKQLSDSFYKKLEFGTGGMRGLMGVGTNRMNKYTLGFTTQGLSNYLKQNYPNQKISVAVAHDSRHNSKEFAKLVSDVFSANGISVHLFSDLRPTPELSFAIRELQCQSGVVITASHNPKEYNGYKVYWADGAQIIAPHDKAIINAVNAIESIDQVNFIGNPDLINFIGEEIDEKFLQTIKNNCLRPDLIKQNTDLKIVYSSIHGTGITLVPKILEELGFKATIVEQQAVPDGSFPTVIYPNPEEKEAMSLAIEKAKEIDADIIVATDPDADRVGAGVRTRDGEYVLLNGNQTAVLMFYYILKQRKEKGTLSKPCFVAKTIVSTYMLDRIAESFGVECVNTLTGFKYIAAEIAARENKQEFIIGAEESYGYMIGDKVRDKDGIAAVAMVAEVASYAKSLGKNLLELLDDIYLEFGLYKEDLVSLTKKGQEGELEIRNMMVQFRENPPKELNGSKVVKIIDYLNLKEIDCIANQEKSIDFEVSNVLQFFTADGSSISVRPSGTEPKIKFYFSVQTKVNRREDLVNASEVLNNKIKTIIQDLGL